MEKREIDLPILEDKKTKILKRISVAQEDLRVHEDDLLVHDESLLLAKVGELLLAQEKDLLLAQE